MVWRHETKSNRVCESTYIISLHMTIKYKLIQTRIQLLEEGTTGRMSESPLWSPLLSALVSPTSSWFLLCLHDCTVSWRCPTSSFTVKSSVSSSSCTARCRYLSPTTLMEECPNASYIFRSPTYSLIAARFFSCVFLYLRRLGVAPEIWVQPY